MKNIHLYIILLFTVNSMMAQDPNNHWKLGASDLDFSTNPPQVSTMTSGGFGSASISDENGDLLFYTDGEIVYNKNHQQMMGGNGFGGFVGSISLSQTVQKAVIAPHPGNLNQYYLFVTTSGPYIGNCGACYGHSYQYFIIDFGDPMHPLGKVIVPYNNDLTYGTPPGNQIQFTRSFMPLTVTKNQNNDGYFLIGAIANSATDMKFLSYEITASGLNLIPIESNITNNTSFEEYYSGTGVVNTQPFGVIKFSPDNAKLGVLVRLYKYHPNTNYKAYSSRFFTLNFNSSTGVFNNFSLVDDTSLSSVESAIDFEFSTDSQKVYLVKDKIYVKNLVNTSVAPRDLSDFTNSSSIPLGFEHIQRDKYGNIWISSSKAGNDRNKYFHKINNQNSFSNSTVQLNSLYLNNNIYPVNYPVNFALPQIIPSFEEPCFDDVTITASVNTGIDKKQAANTIIASNVINTNAAAIYHAGSSVKLSNGFHAKAGSTFRGYIEGCSGNYVARMTNSSNEETNEYNVEEKNIATLYPNPNKGVFSIRIDKPIDEVLQIEIYNSYGKIVHMNTLGSKDIAKEFNLVDVPAGIYFVKVLGNNINESIKFVKQ